MSELQKILDGILAEAEAATDEPWEQHENVDNKLTVFAHETSIAETHRCNLLNKQKLVNATFIAHSRTNVPRLCKALGMITEEVVDGREALGEDGDFAGIRSCNEFLAHITAILKGEKNES